MWYSCIPLALAVRYTSPSRRSITHSVGAHVADVLATSKAGGGRGRTAVGVDTPGVSIRAGVDAGRGRVFRVTQTPRRGGDRTAVGAWTRAGVPCAETPRKGVRRRWGAWTRRVWVGAWAFARAGMDTWHGRAFRATQTPCGGGGRTVVGAWTTPGVGVGVGVRARRRGHLAQTGIPCDADAMWGRGSDGGGGVHTGGCSVRRNAAHGGGGRTAVGGVDTPGVGVGVSVRGRGRGHLARTGVPCDADAVRGRGCQRHAT
ncbi:hypothetical protein GGX14DRAFT_396757 [Mycena pura]|uniref:Uncharacterized protein n=1 Tax=Mycena pura TaxID=153505 RepID=A0AAD6VH00_9AGAR|nr:hypothetical protein GGX14DRAFT_396757 [Mycena pura]